MSAIQQCMPTILTPVAMTNTVQQRMPPMPVPMTNTVQQRMPPMPVPMTNTVQQRMPPMPVPMNNTVQQRMPPMPVAMTNTVQQRMPPMPVPMTNTVQQCMPPMSGPMTNTVQQRMPPMPVPMTNTVQQCMPPTATTATINKSSMSNYVTVYHYTDRAGADAILRTGIIYGSRSGGGDAIFGDGVYLTSMAPQTPRIRITENNYGGFSPEGFKRTEYAFKINIPMVNLKEIPYPGRDILLYTFDSDLRLDLYQWELIDVKKFQPGQSVGVPGTMAVNRFLPPTTTTMTMLALTA